MVSAEGMLCTALQEELLARAVCGAVQTYLWSCSEGARVLLRLPS